MDKKINGQLVCADCFHKIELYPADVVIDYPRTWPDDECSVCFGGMY